MTSGRDVRAVRATEGPEGHELRPPVDDRAVPWRVFLAIGVFMVVIGAIYWGTSYEAAGIVMLLLAGALALWISSYLWRRTRTAVGPEEGSAGETTADGGEHYMPHASAWPFAIGLGAATVANGLVLGLWVVVPGVALMALGVGGFVRQTRHRD